ncbi:MAG: 1-deoxy-D-xylulose-5-phosphate synthase [Lachnospiraceae bacterium]
MDETMLEKIKEPNDIKKIDPSFYPALAQEIREFLLERVSKTGGHLASSLGTVELTMALHLVLDFPEDQCIWDVGHQAYTHKILTGRKDAFDSLRQYGGLSGFPKRKESPCDAFDTGHSSTSLSAALGMAHARDLQHQKHTIVAVIGDGSLSGGMAYEALNNMENLKSNLIIVLNDNQMSISRNVGGMAAYLGKIRTGDSYHMIKSDVHAFLKHVPVIGAKLDKSIQKSKNSIKQLFIPDMLFEDMGITYIGPIDGHDIHQMVEIFQNAKRMQEPVLIHVTTQKGKGYQKAEQNPARFHGIEPFDVASGSVNKPKQMSYTGVFSQKMMEYGEKNEKVAAITAAMPIGTGLVEFSKKYPKRFFDVGIAEQHAVTFAAGLAAAGMKPVVAIYSSFLQRAYDQIVHDVCIQKLPVVFAVDRSGLVGADGETHQGILDTAYLSSIPNLTVLAPSDKHELEKMLDYAMEYDGPIAVKYPRGIAYEGTPELSPIEYGKSSILKEGKGCAIISVGHMRKEVEQAVSLLEKHQIFPTVLDARFLCPFDEEKMIELANTHDTVVVVEEMTATGSFAQMVANALEQHGCSTRFMAITLPDRFIEQGTVAKLREVYQMDAKSIAERIMDFRK